MRQSVQLTKLDPAFETEDVRYSPLKPLMTLSPKNFDEEVRESTGSVLRMVASK